jgi:hypothetical protein
LFLSFVLSFVFSLLIFLLFLNLYLLSFHSLPLFPASFSFPSFLSSLLSSMSFIFYFVPPCLSFRFSNSDIHEGSSSRFWRIRRFLISMNARKCLEYRLQYVVSGLYRVSQEEISLILKVILIGHSKQKIVYIRVSYCYFTETVHCTLSKYN